MPTPPGGGSRLDKATHTVISRPELGEATLIVGERASGAVADALSELKRSLGGTRRGAAVDPVRSADEADRRARATIRRWCVKNGATRLATLTFAEAVFDWEELWAAVEVLRRRLAAEGFPTAVLAVPEVHPKGHGWHVHCAVAEYVPKEVLARCWGRGFVDIRKVNVHGYGRHHQGGRAQARAVAGYIAGYVTKLKQVPIGEAAGGEEAGASPVPRCERPFNGKRYSTPRGTSMVTVIRCVVPSRVDALEFLERQGFDWEIVWRSPSTQDGWRGPPTMLVFG